MITARIQFADGTEAREFAVELTNPWRLCADDFAVALKPVCNEIARVVEVMPSFERVEIVPVGVGVPEFLLANHADEVEAMRQSYLAGQNDRIFNCHDFPTGPTPQDRWNGWPWFVLNVVKPRLWSRYRTPELADRWLVWDDPRTDGLMLNLAARYPNHPSGPHATFDDLQTIRFRARFHHGGHITTIFLVECFESPLTVEEQRSLPSFIAEQRKLRAAAEALAAAAAKTAAAGQIISAGAESLAKTTDKIESLTDTLAAREAGIREVAKPFRDIYAQPAVVEAHKASREKDVPEMFIQWTLGQWHARKFPSPDEARKAVETTRIGSTPLAEAIEAQGGGTSRAQLARYLRVIRKEMEKRRLIEPRRIAKPSKQPAPETDVGDSDLPSPPAPARPKEERTGESDRDTRAQELPDSQDWDS